MTPEDRSQIQKDTQTLFTLASKQLDEHKAYLYNKFATDPELKVSIELRASLMRAVQSIALTCVRVEVHAVTRQPFAQTVYEFPDVLFDFLASPACPADFAEVLRGGVDLTHADKPTAEDPMPKTGKSVERIRKHIRQRGRE